jgi:CxxC-x17-CxxC domain-containing protein
VSFQGKSIVCFDCGATFIFTVEEQEFFATKGYINEPRRCHSCRQARKQEQGNTNSYRNNGYTQTSPRQMYSAFCARCGKSTNVPFEPKSGRPVYCRDCYDTVKVSR